MVLVQNVFSYRMCSLIECVLSESLKRDIGVYWYLFSHHCTRTGSSRQDFCINFYDFCLILCVKRCSHAALTVRLLANCCTDHSPITTLALTHSLSHVHTHTLNVCLSHSHSHSHSHTLTGLFTYIHTHTHTHTHTYIHTHTYNNAYPSERLGIQLCANFC